MLVMDVSRAFAPNKDKASCKKMWVYIFSCLLGVQENASQQVWHDTRACPP